MRQVRAELAGEGGDGSAPGGAGSAAGAGQGGREEFVACWGRPAWGAAFSGRFGGWWRREL